MAFSSKSKARSNAVAQRPSKPPPESAAMSRTPEPAVPAPKAATAVPTALATPPRSPEQAVSDEMISARAYEIWERLGRPSGHSEENWHAARVELEQERLNWAAPREDDRDRTPGD
jgi:hypothetical protein